ncbi:MAG TPA: M56 family metallopeptidase [Thermoanaerobaculia bacterium]|nr:M56 family metallopeptidase [Thermoanaerobaculia bacterium]
MIGLLVREYGVHLFHWFWQTALVAELALAVVRLLPRSSAPFRAAVLSLAFWKFLLPPMLPLPTGLFSRLPIVGSVAGLPSRLLAAAIVALAAVHAAGAGMQLAAILRGRRALQRCLAQGARRGKLRVAVVRSGLPVKAPAVFGGLRPALLLPAALRTLSSTQRRIVFAHERCHLERGDGLMTLAEEALRVCAWIHPSFARVISELRRIREELCDAAVLVRTGVSVDDYAGCLLAAAALASGAPPCASSFAAIETVAALRRRIAALDRRADWSKPELCAALLLWVVLLPGIRPWA